MDPKRRRIVIQTTAMILVWLGIWFVANRKLGTSVALFSAGLCFILPFHVVRVFSVRE